MLFSILGSFCSFFDWEGAEIQPLINLGKIPVSKSTKKALEHNNLDRS